MSITPSTPLAPARDGDKLYIPQQNRQLPSLCVKCGRPSTNVLKKTFSWHAPWLYILVFIAVLIYIIVAAIVRKSIALEVPLCDEHRDARKKKVWIATAMLVGCIPVGIAVGVASPDGGYGVAVGIIMFFAGVVFAAMAGAIIAPTHIDATYAEFKGVSPEFLRQLPAKA